MTDVGRRLARLRVPLGFLVAVFALLLARPSCGTLGIGLAVSGVGEAIRVWASGHVQKGIEVTRSGPYRFLRHPLYVGSALMGIGFAIASRSIPVAICIGLYLGLTLTSAVRVEERAMREKFGSAYDEYVAGRGHMAARRFSLDLAIRNREHRAVAGFLAMAILLALRTGCLGLF